MKKYPLLKIALLYFLLGSLWLLAGAVVINWIDNQYPSVNLQGLHFFKNLIFLIATSVLVLFSLNYYYRKRFRAERRHKTELLLKNQKLKEIAWLNSHEIRRPLANLTALVQLIRPSIDDIENLIPILNHLETSVCELNEAVIKMNNQTKELEE